MKKSTLAIGIIVALGAVWTGGAWYTGKKAEAEYQQYLAQANEKLQPYDIQIENTSFERGIFSSDVAYSVRLGKDGKETLLPFSGKLYHGPLPLNRLSRFDFAPAVFSSETVIVKQDDTQAWFEQAGGDNPLRTSSTVGYNGKTDVALDFAASKTVGDNFSLAWGKGSIHYQFDGSKTTQLAWDIGKLALQGKQSQWGGQVYDQIEVNIDNFKGQADWQDTAFAYIKNINSKGSAEKYHTNTVQDGVSHTTDLQNWQFDAQLGEKDGFLDLKMKDSARLPVSELDYQGNYQLEHLEHIAADALSSLFNAIALRSSLGDALSAEQNQEIDGHEEAAWKKLLENQPHFVINADLKGSDDKHFALKFNLALGDVPAALAANQLFGVFKQLDLSIDSDRAVLKTVVSNLIASINNVPLQEAEKLYDHNADGVLQQLVSESILSQKDNRLALDLKIADNQLQLNERKFSEQELQMMFFALMMLYGGFGQ